MRAGLKGTVNILPIVIKGIVHPKIVFLSLYTHSHVVPNPYYVLSCAEHKRRYFEYLFQSLWSTLNLIVGKKRILWKSLATSSCLVTHILQNILFCVQHKKEMHSGLKQLESE